MAFQLSPGINLSEIDLTSSVTGLSTSIGAIGGKFVWGPCNQIVDISDEIRLKSIFGGPKDENYEYWFSAANFLSYSNNLKVVRAANTVNTLNATDSGVGVPIVNSDAYFNNFSSGQNTYGAFAAKYASDIGNSIRVEMADANTFSTWAYANYFTDAPDTSDYIGAAGGSNDELHIVIVDEGAMLTGFANNVLERFAFVSKASNAKTIDGASNYYKDVLNNRSNYIWSLSHPVSNTNWGTSGEGKVFDNLEQPISKRLSGGSNGNITNIDIIRAYSIVSDPDAVDISLLISGPGGADVINHLIDNIALKRKDCCVFLSPPKSTCVDNSGNEVEDIVSFRGQITSSDYAMMDSGWKYQYDKYNDTYRWIPLNADIAGLCARTDAQFDPWYSPAGPSRGVIRNLVKLSWNPSKNDRDNLYIKGVNPVVTFQGEGTILFGDKTLLTRPSAFDRINVRRLFITLEKTIAKASRTQLFNINDSFSRAQFKGIVEPFLRDVQGRRGISDFKVVCDESNNTNEIVERNEFVGDIYIKPIRSTNFIQLNFVAVRNGVSFDEIAGRLGQ